MSNHDHETNLSAEHQALLAAHQDIMIARAAKRGEATLAEADDCPRLAAEYHELSERLGASYAALPPEVKAALA